MTKYSLLAEAIQEKLDNGELSLEDANVLNDMAYEKYADEEVSDSEVYEESEGPVTLGEVLNFVEASLDKAIYNESSEEEVITEEDVQNTIDRVHAAYESGLISEEDALAYLEMLDLDNYQ